MHVQYVNHGTNGTVRVIISGMIVGTIQTAFHGRGWQFYPLDGFCHPSEVFPTIALCKNFVERGMW